MSVQITMFWGKRADVRSYPPPLGSLYIDPDGMGSGPHLSLLFGSDMPLDEQVVIADRVLAAVQRWRDDTVEKATRERAAQKELAEARAEIARLKGETGGAQ
ncbi:hypothetical protein [Streptomyces sp. SID8352]|uniref:hypothetical protein n=1 Tax=Streptomyces sp. SID8352 TaxID=2690338 RepID=UPI00136A5CB8|nr:hypothetical protein [Streptomyces sp. SID8352]MYU24516.1 hypothetical protein [Streptomyces sp. SID8352]